MFRVVKLRLQRSWKWCVGCAWVSAMLGWLLWEGLPQSQRLEWMLFDEGVRFYTNKPWFPPGVSQKSADIALLAIDDKTFAEISKDPSLRQRYGAWPFDRRLWADVFEKLQAVGARGIVLDAVVDEPRPDETGDLAMAGAISKLEIPVILGFNVVPTATALPKTATPTNRLHPASPSTPAPDERESFEDFFSEELPRRVNREKEDELLRQKAAQAFAFPVKRKGVATPLLSTTSLEEPPHPIPLIEPLLETATGFGLVLPEADADAVIRRTRFSYSDGQNDYVSLSVAMMADLLGASQMEISPGRLKLGEREWRIHADGSAEIPYRGKLHDRFSSTSLIDFIRLSPDSKVAGELLGAKVVFIAGFAMGTSDEKATPLETFVPGVMKHASELDALLQGRFIDALPLWVSLLVALVLAGFVAACIISAQSSVADILFPLVVVLGGIGVSGVLVVGVDLHLLAMPPLFSGVLSSLLTSSYSNVFARKERKHLKAMFSAYMEAELVEQMAESMELPKLDGKNLLITAFFSDIQGFSSFSERMKDDPKALMCLLNRYLGTVTPAITRQGGCIDKFIGDAVVALFGAPIEHADHALRACRAALDVQKAVNALRTELSKEGLPDVRTRIGLNTDVMLVGNIGSEAMMDYTAIGDGMNLAARLEGANKAFGTGIALGPKTAALVQEVMVVRELDWVRVAGKKEKIVIYELVGEKAALTPLQSEVLSLYAKALASFRARQFSDAMTKLKALFLLDAQDTPSLRLLKRCEEALKNPPDPSWEAVADLGK